MKIYAHIDGIFQQQVGDSAFLELITIYPEGRAGSHGHSFQVHLPVDDARVVGVFDALQRRGLRRWNPLVPRSEHASGAYFHLQLERVYDTSDLDEFRFFEFHLPSNAYHLQIRRDNAGRLAIPLPPSPTDLAVDVLNFMCGDGADWWYFVPTRVSDILVEEQLDHLVLAPTETIFLEKSSTSNLVMKEGLYWEVNSDFIMPPVSPGMALVDKQRRQVWPGPATNIYRQEGLYRWPELHYRASDLRAIGPFDIARTFENFGWGGEDRMPDRSPVIVSKRFYDVCQKHGFKVDWLPVHIDPI